jgi:hypothetical protein
MASAPSGIVTDAQPVREADVAERLPDLLEVTAGWLNLFHECRLWHRHFRH